MSFKHENAGKSKKDSQKTQFTFSDLVDIGYHRFLNKETNVARKLK